ncbi:UNVERIFIED_ORG: hypothetical protein L601_000800000360 [Gordonia westfalica J30]
MTQPTDVEPPDLPAPPPGLDDAGRALWERTFEEYEDLSAHEEQLLLEACRTADALDRLQRTLDRDGVLNESSQGTRVHPALPELRQQRVTFARLIAVLGLPTGEQDESSPKPQRRSARGTYDIKGP